LAAFNHPLFSLLSLELNGNMVVKTINEEGMGQTKNICSKEFV